MPIKDNNSNPSRPRSFANILLLVAGLFLLLNLLSPLLFAPRITKVPYSMFIHQVRDREVAQASVGQDEIRYQLKGEAGQPGQLFSTTPIFDLELPKLLEEQGVEFTAVAPPRGNWFTNILGWTIPPLIFVAVWQFFIGRGMGGAPQGALSITKSKAKIYVEGEAAKITFADVAGVEEAKAELVEVVDFLQSPQRFTQIGARIPRGCC